MTDPEFRVVRHVYIPQKVQDSYPAWLHKQLAWCHQSGQARVERALRAMRDVYDIPLRDAEVGLTQIRGHAIGGRKPSLDDLDEVRSV